MSGRRRRRWQWKSRIGRGHRSGRRIRFGVRFVGHDDLDGLLESFAVVDFVVVLLAQKFGSAFLLGRGGDSGRNGRAVVALASQQDALQDASVAEQRVDGWRRRRRRNDFPSGGRTGSRTFVVDPVLQLLPIGMTMMVLVVIHRFRRIRRLLLRMTTAESRAERQRSDR